MHSHRDKLIPSYILATLSLIIVQAVFGLQAHGTPLIRDTDRIVFVGDSITGQGGNGGADGWVQMIGEGLRAAHPGASQTLVALGGSGQTVGSWANIEKDSQTKPVFLDVKGVDVKAELDKPADVLVVMLGMNDVLAPSLQDAPADIDAWAVKYKSLVDSLVAGSHPRVVGLATVTPCTEDPQSPKNKVIDKLNLRIGEYAKLNGYSLLPTNQSAWTTLANGRTYSPTYHVTRDTVHPTAGGHIAIAAGMLDGFGETAAAKYLRDNRLQADYTSAAGPLPSLSYTVATVIPESTASAESPDYKHFVVTYSWHDKPGTTMVPSLTIAVPPGFKSSPKIVRGATEHFYVAGLCDHLETHLTLTANAGATSQSATITIPAAWIAFATPPGQPGWTIRDPWTFDPVAGTLPIDTRIADGTAFGDEAIKLGDTPLKSVRYTPSIDYVGGANPASIDFAAVSFFANFTDGYAARWVYSSKARAVQLAFSFAGWGGDDHLQVWVNGASAYAGHFGRGPASQAVAPANLNAGWNSLVLKSAHLQWLWQVAVALNPVAGDNLDDLRYSTVQEPTVPHGRAK